MLLEAGDKSEDEGYLFLRLSRGYELTKGHQDDGFGGVASDLMSFLMNFPETWI